MSHVEEETGTRRDFLYVATGAAGVVTAGAAVWPLVNQMNPSADVEAMSTIQVDISGVQEGTQITALFQGKPIFIRHRTQKEIDEAKAVDLSELRDTNARNPNLKGDAPATDINRTIGEREDWLVMIGVCTHLGCVPIGEAGDYDGWFCPCHGSHYDTAGRIRKGPAPENLHLPVAEYMSDTVIKLG